MQIEVKLPNLGEGVDSADVLSVLVHEGDQVQNGQGLIELETDKATMEVPSPETGTIQSIHIAEGDTLSVGALIVTLEATAGATAPANDQPPAAIEPEAEPAPAQVSEPRKVEKPLPAKSADVKPEPRAKPQAPATAPAKSRPKTELRTLEGDVPGDGRSSAAAGPAVRRLARDLGVDLRDVQGTGKGGRITDDDVRGFVRGATARTVKSAPEKKKKKKKAKHSAPQAAADEYGPVRREKMSRLRQTIAKNMLHSYTTIPQLTNFDDVDVTDLENVRQQSKKDYAAKGLKLTMLPFLIRAVAAGLRRHEIVNASYDAETHEILYKQYVHISIAVDTDRGLIVPVMRDVDEMSVPQITRSLATLSEKVREGDFSVDELRGGTFTISNLGAVGGTYSTPIINPPQVAILLVGRSRIVPVMDGQKVVGRLMMPLSITYDHRVVDGAAAARFLNDVKAFLSTPGRLLLAP